MSEEENEVPGFILGMAEFIQHQQKQHDHHEMSVDDAQHRLQSLFHEADKESLEAIQTLMRVMIHAESPAMLAAYYDGIISALLSTKHNICVACGSDHDEELAVVAADEEGTNQ